MESITKEDQSGGEETNSALPVQNGSIKVESLAALHINSEIDLKPPVEEEPMFIEPYESDFCIYEGVSKSELVKEECCHHNETEQDLVSIRTELIDITPDNENKNNLEMIIVERPLSVTKSEFDSSEDHDLTNNITCIQNETLYECEQGNQELSIKSECYLSKDFDITNNIIDIQNEMLYKWQRRNQKFSIKSKFDSSKDFDITNNIIDIQNEMVHERDNHKFLNMEKLKMHSSAQNSEKPFQCDVCDYSFVLKSHLNKHMQIHNKETFFFCDVNNTEKILHESDLYDKTVQDQADIEIDPLSDQQQPLAHISVKTFKCNLCDQTFISKPNLRKHVLTHAAEKSFKCSICDYKCKCKYRLKYHMVIHTNKKPFNCDFCNYKCRLKRRLEDHVRLKHNNGEPFMCNLCDYRCSLKINLEEHMHVHDAETLLCDVKIKQEN